MLRVLAVISTVVLLAACGNSAKRENIEPPTALTELKPTASISLAWQHKLGKGERRMGLRQHPASDGKNVYAADPSGKLYAFDANSGAGVWQVETELALSSSVAVGEDTLVVGTLDGDVIAFNPDSGTERWRARVSSEVLAAPAISRGIVVVRSNDGRAYAFSITDGERRWVYDHATPALSLRGNSAPVMADGTVLIGYDDGQLVALRADDGVQLWAKPIAFGEGRSELERMVDIDGAVAFERGQAFAAAFNGQVEGISLDAGRPLWNRELSSYGGIAMTSDKVIVADREGVLWALDRASGSAMWKQDSLLHRWLTTPAVQGNLVAVGDVEGYVHWFDLETGAPAARQRLDKEPIRATPVVSGDMLYVVSIEGKLGAYRQ